MGKEVSKQEYRGFIILECRNPELQSIAGIPEKGNATWFEVSNYNLPDGHTFSTIEKAHEAIDRHLQATNENP
ncbi:MAG: hypothetical protein OXC62_02345 [Aestuariivita sp.]|nr:hypothetical protein [Aestuariivita sp.]